MIVVSPKCDHPDVPELTVRLAGPDDVEGVLDLLGEAASWIRVSTGIDQWPQRFPRQFVADLVDEGGVYVMLDAEQLVATLCLQWADSMFWPNADDEALYVHRLVVKRSHAGRGIGEQLLAWAAELAAGAGRSYLRLDCMTENTRLRRYYEALGFHHQGDVSGDNPPPFNASFRPRWQTSLYEKRVRP